MKKLSTSGIIMSQAASYAMYSGLLEKVGDSQTVIK